MSLSKKYYLTVLYIKLSSRISSVNVPLVVINDESLQRHFHNLLDLYGQYCTLHYYHSQIRMLK